MAKRRFSPALWFLLALMLRAELVANSQTRYPSSSKTAPTTSKTTSSQSLANKPAERTTSARGDDPAVKFELSGESYSNGSHSAEPATRHRTVNRTLGRTLRSTDAVQSAYGDPAYEDRPRANQNHDLVDYEAENFEEVGDGPLNNPDYGYAEELGEEEYWDEEDGYETEHPHGIRHWLHSFKSEHSPWFRTSKNSPRDIGLGEPLKGTSWLNRPNSASFFVGILNGDELIADRVGQGSALFGGLRFGWDFDHYWGMEVRGGWSSPDIEYEPAPPPDRVDGIFLMDASFLYYPWGDSAWRPYALLGMGMARFDFTDEVGLVHDEYLLGIPIGLGMKYQYHPNLVFRAEFLDNIACGSSGLNTMNNLSFSLGLEIRFGGKPRSYYPWQPAKFIW